MALQKTINLNVHGVSVELSECYIRLESFRGNKNEITITAVFYTNNREEVIKSDEYIFTPDLNGQNFIIQGYQYLKTLPKFSGATDV